MSEHTPIEWADATWSPWEGCTKVSLAATGGGGCDNCYAARMNGWLRNAENWGSGAPRRAYSAAHWEKPERWNAKAAREGKRLRVFPSVCDPFDNEVPQLWRTRFFALIDRTPHLTWLLLTKRIGNAARMLRADVPEGVRASEWEHVLLGATVVNQPEADRDIDKLLAIDAAGHFISYEPALGPLDATRWLTERPVYRGDDTSGFIDYGQALAWVIAGGESGPHARPAHPDWFRSLRDQCAAAGVPFLFKQWGEWAPNCLCGTPHAHRDTPRPEPGKRGCMFRCGKAAAGRLLDGVEHNGVPAC